MSPPVQQLQRLRQRWRYLVRDVAPESLRPAARIAVVALRLLYAVARDLAEGQLTLRAMSLVYTTLLSIVPLLAVSFSVLKAFGVHNQIEPVLAGFLAPLGPKGEEITARIIGFVENVQVGVLGSLGLALLLYVVLSLIQKIERALNYTWRIRRLRPLRLRVSGYLSVLLVGPVLMFSAIGLMASIRAHFVVERILAIEPFGTLAYWTGQIAPYLLVIATFTIVYMLIPNTRVRLRSALVGGAVAGVLWKVLAWAFTTFAISSTRYAAIYSGFAILLLFMIWLYLNWLTLLIGAQVAYYHQHPQAIHADGPPRCPGACFIERLALLVMALLGAHFYHGGRPWTAEALARRLAVPVEPVQDVLAVVQARGLAVETADDPPGYVPAHDPAGITLKALLDAVRAQEQGAGTEVGRSLPEVERALERLDAAFGEGLGGLTVRDLVGPSPRGPETPGRSKM